MRVFELHFNPKIKDDIVSDSFVFEPENSYEKRLGNLYIVGELTKALPQNCHFLNDLATTIKKEYYQGGLKKSAEMSLKDSLKKANEFLDRETKKGNVSWLGNLSFAALNYQDFILNFSKVGDIKILLQRDKEILDISQNLEFQDIEPYPLKVFGNIATGKLALEDKIMVMTEEVFSVLSQDDNFLSQLIQAISEKDIKEILRTKKQTLSEISGICLLLMVKEGKELKEVIGLGKIVPFSKIKLPKITLTIPNKKIILVLALILLLAVGFLIFK